MTLENRIAALPTMPPSIPAEAAGYASAMSARLALLRDTLQAMVEHVEECDCPEPEDCPTCAHCADARRVLEATCS